MKKVVNSEEARWQVQNSLKRWEPLSVRKSPDAMWYHPHRENVFPGDTKVTDMLYSCYHLAIQEEDFDEQLDAIKARYQEIIDGLKLDLSLNQEFKVIRENFSKKVGCDYAASRGEYLNGMIMAAYLGYEFIDAGRSDLL